MRNVWPTRALCFVHFAVWKERKIWAKVEIVLLTSWDVRWCVIYRIHVVHGGTRYIYHRIKVSIEVFVDNPVITALETSRHWPGPLMKDPLDISVLCSLPRAWRTWERAGCSPGWSSLPSGMETLRPLPLLGELPGLYLNNSQSSVSCSHGGYSLVFN